MERSLIWHRIAIIILSSCIKYILSWYCIAASAKNHLKNRSLTLIKLVLELTTVYNNITTAILSLKITSTFNLVQWFHIVNRHRMPKIETLQRIDFHKHRSSIKNPFAKMINLFNLSSHSPLSTVITQVGHAQQRHHVGLEKLVTHQYRNQISNKSYSASQ